MIGVPRSLRTAPNRSIMATMSNLDERIAQFEKMAADDPDNDMAHFSLGSAYLQEGRHADAAGSLQRCIELNGQMSKAYQLAGQALIASGHPDEAASILARGYEVAAGKGDMMPRNEIANLLRPWRRESIGNRLTGRTDEFRPCTPRYVLATVRVCCTAVRA